MASWSRQQGRLQTKVEHLCPCLHAGDGRRWEDQFRVQPRKCGDEADAPAAHGAPRHRPCAHRTGRLCSEGQAASAGERELQCIPTPERQRQTPSSAGRGCNAKAGFCITSASTLISDCSFLSGFVDCKTSLRLRSSQLPLGKEKKLNTNGRLIKLEHTLPSLGNNATANPLDDYSYTPPYTPPNIWCRVAVSIPPPPMVWSPPPLNPKPQTLNPKPQTLNPKP